MTKRKRLGVKEDRAAELKGTIHDLAAHEPLVPPTRPARGVRRMRAGPRGRVVGVFRRMEAGYGFVRPAPTGPTDVRTLDVYIPSRESGDASTGDLVLVQLSRRSGGARPGPRGQIVQVIERESHRFVGTYLETAGAGCVEVDGKLFARPILVGDAGACGVRPLDKVVVEMIRFPSHFRQGEGVVTEVLGPRGKPGVDTLSILREFGLPDGFPEDVLQEARQEVDRFLAEAALGAGRSRSPSRAGSGDPGRRRPLKPDRTARHASVQHSADAGRLDLTALATITIDPADARDFDDAVSLTRLADGRWRLGVHIADVAHFVRPKTALDREAYARATSVYLPDRVVPMLPELISNGVASLQPRKVRYTKSVFMEFTADGLRTSTEVCSAAIKSRRRLTYEQVDDFLTALGAAPKKVPAAFGQRGEKSPAKLPSPRDPKSWRRRLGAKVYDMLAAMHELAMVLRRRRIERGALELSMPEVKIELDPEGRVTGARVMEHTESHQIIEEFMLAANEAVAELLVEKGVPFLRRIHNDPSPRKLKALSEFVAELGLKTESLESRFALQRLLADVVGRPEQHAVHYAALRSLERAVYGPAEEGHYALASNCYCHFTSPIRRYPDLTVHRLIEAILAGKTPSSEPGRLLAVGEHCSDREQRAEAAERELVKLKLLNYLSRRTGEEMDAVVTGVESFGLFVQGLRLPAEGLIHLSSLPDDRYRFDRTTHTLTGSRAGNTFRLGDLLRVAVLRADPDQRELDFRLVKRLGHPGSVPKARGRRKKKSVQTGKSKGARRKKCRKDTVQCRKR